MQSPIHGNWCFIIFMRSHISNLWALASLKSIIQPTKNC